MEGRRAGRRAGAGCVSKSLSQVRLGTDKFRRLVQDIDWYDLAPRLSPDRIYIFAASDDHFFDPGIVEEMWRRWGRPAIRWYPGSHMGSSCACPRDRGSAALHRRVTWWAHVG